MSDAGEFSRAELVRAIAARVRPTICPTFSQRGETVEGRISLEDFETLIGLAAPPNAVAVLPMAREAVREGTGGAAPVIPIGRSRK